MLLDLGLRSDRCSCTDQQYTSVMAASSSLDSKSDLLVLCISTCRETSGDLWCALGSHMLLHPKCTMSRLLTMMFMTILYGHGAVLISSLLQTDAFAVCGCWCLSRGIHDCSWETVRAPKF